jgi:hypothetical protein
VRFTRLGSATETASVTKPEGSVKASVASNSLYRVPIKPKMSLGSIKQAVSDLGQAAKDLVGSGITPGPSGLAAAASKSSLTSTTASAEGTLVDVSDNVTGSAVEAAPNGTSLDWTEDDAMSLLYTESGATDNLPHHLQLQDQVPFTPVFTAEEAAASAAMGTSRETGSPVGGWPSGPYWQLPGYYGVLGNHANYSHDSESQAPSAASQETAPLWWCSWYSETEETLLVLQKASCVCWC